VQIKLQHCSLQLNDKIDTLEQKKLSSKMENFSGEGKENTDFISLSWD